MGVGEAQTRKSDYPAVDGRSLRAGKLQAGATTSEGQQRQCRHRRDDRREIVWTPERALASHPRTTPQRNLHTTTGETGGNPEAGRRGAQAGHSDSAGSVHPASGAAGAAEELGRNVL